MMPAAREGTAGAKPDDFDLVVIGAGPAGLAGAIAGGILGARVALVERSSALGGALINTGTIPSKTLRETALALSGYQSRKLYGVDLSLRRGARVADFLYHERHVKTTARANVAERLVRLGITRITGSARFLDSTRVEVVPTSPRGGRPRKLHARFVLIATGSRPTRPREFPFEHPQVWDSDEILELERLPRQLAVIGAGVIGSEYASMFAALGAKVDLVDGRETLLPFLDREIARVLTRAMTTLGIRFRWRERVTACRAPARGPIRLTLTSGPSLRADAVLVAAGRRAVVEDLRLEAAGLSTDERGHLHVDARFQTQVPNILAAGDVVGFPALASVSAEQARLAVSTALGHHLKEVLDPLFPSGIYTIPEVSTVGATEEELRAQGVDYVVGRARYADNARGAIIGDSAGLLKLIFRREDMKLLGVHMLGEQATELVHVGLMILLHGGGADALHRACFNVPTLATLYKDAAYRAQIARDLPSAAARRAMRQQKSDE
jgi:NAD(P) transhydrogenase